jgi:hypothetical protein
MGIAVRAARGRRGLLLASSSLVALLIGGGAPSGYAAFPGTFFFNGASIAGVGNSGAIACIDIQNSTISGNVTNTSTGVLTPQGTGTPSRTGITINNSTINGAIVNQGTITATVAPSASAVRVFNNAVISSGITNSGTISAKVNGINVTAVSTFDSGLTNSGAISANDSGISNSGTISPKRSGVSVSVSTFAGDISNGGTISTTSGYGISVADSVVGFALAGSGINWGLAQGLGTGRNDAVQAGVYDIICKLFP